SRARRNACAIALASALLVAGIGTALPADAKPSTDLAVTQNVDNATPQFAQHVVLTTTVENLGTAKAKGVKPTVQIPSGLSVVSWSDGKPHRNGRGGYDPSSGAWKIGALPAGAHATLTITARAGDVVIGDRTVTATVHAKTADPDPTNNIASTTLHSVAAP